MPTCKDCGGYCNIHDEVYDGLCTTCRQKRNQPKYEYEFSFKPISVKANTEEEAKEKVRKEVINGNLEIDEILDAREL